MTVKISTLGESFIEPLTPYRAHQFTAANGVVECRANVSFSILVTNLSRPRVHLQKGRIISNLRNIATKGEIERLALSSTPDNASLRGSKQDAPIPSIADVDLCHLPEELHDKAPAILLKHSHM